MPRLAIERGNRVAVIRWAGCLVIAGSSTIPRDGLAQAHSAEAVVTRELQSTTLEFARIAAVVMLRDGSIVVGDGASRKLHVFSGTGEHERTLGGRGNGPGELDGIGLIGVGVDTFYVVQRPPFASQMNVFTAKSGFVKRSTIRAVGTAGVTPLAYYGGSQMLVSGSGMRPIAPLRAGATRRDTVRLGVLNAETGSASWIGLRANRTWISYPTGDELVATSMVAQPLGPALTYAASASGFWIGDTSTGDVEEYDLTGRLVRRIDWPLPGSKLSRASVAKARHLELMRAATALDSARTMAQFNEGTLPERAPRFLSFLASHSNELWVETFSTDPKDPPLYLILASQTRPRARVRVPNGMTLRYVRDSVAVGTMEDADGFQHVFLLKIRQKM